MALSPVFPKTMHRQRTDTTTAAAGSISAKRDKIFSKSRDVREDRGSRQMKTSNNPRSGR
jgi:hypothetical protein